MVERAHAAKLNHLCPLSLGVINRRSRAES